MLDGEPAGQRCVRGEKSPALLRIICCDSVPTVPGDDVHGEKADAGCRQGEGEAVAAAAVAAAVAPAAPRKSGSTSISISASSASESTGVIVAWAEGKAGGGVCAGDWRVGRGCVLASGEVRCARVVVVVVVVVRRFCGAGGGQRDSRRERGMGREQGSREQMSGESG